MSAEPWVNERQTIFYSLLDIEKVNRSSESKYGQTVFREHTLIILTEGSGHMAWNGTPIPLQQGTGMILEPGSVGRIECTQGEMSFTQLKFRPLTSTGETLNGVAQAPVNGLTRCGPVSCEPFSQCLLLLNALDQYHHSEQEIERFVSHIRFQELLLLILRAQLEQSAAKDTKSAVRRSIEYMKENYQQSLTVDQLAELAGTSRSRYTTLFKEITGQLPLDYLNWIRIDRAQQLLLLTGDRLNTIAQAVGYSNEYYFNRRFKGTIGMTPGQYRHSHQEKRIFAPFLEDFLLALGIKPVVQYCHAHWGRQEYLQLQEIPEFDISSGNWEVLSGHRPELILLDQGHERWSLEECRRVAPLFRLPYGCEDWRSTLRTVAAVSGRLDSVSEVIMDYEQHARQAQLKLRRSVRSQTVAVLRISACGAVLYGCGELGYIGNVLYRDLGLLPHPLVQQWTRGERRVSLTGEMLSRLEADHLFITFDKQEGEGRSLLDSKLWRSLPAVRSGCVYEVDFMAWMNYGVLSHRRKIDDVLQVLA
ncbi:AraC family transcriptional regulator [Paenibacillus donghaensis]|uniref:AraC family transcriptional regulator n=1 Tax=Paenibacillus donghaensis TaxID=414771 RepID=A0A2Z2K6G1_9BACL|nr:helix-turn-helix domain-containing protein [Paenibacillus donghaensis]ASA20377.1 AraC family transcriptional regulator [Paenibacillus donghaensis]